MVDISAMTRKISQNTVESAQLDVSAYQKSWAIHLDVSTWSFNQRLREETQDKSRFTQSLKFNKEERSAFS